MKALNSFVRRNCMNYFRDRSAVFFSLLSMFIVIMLMVVFIGDMNVKSIVNLLGEYGGEGRDAAADKNNAQVLEIMWMTAGLVVVNAVMVTLTMIGHMIEDAAAGKQASFFVAPVSRYTITMGYILASVLVGIFMCVLTVVVAQIYVVVIGGSVLGVMDFIKILGIIVLTVFTSSSLMFLLAVFVSTESAWGGLGTTIGTLVGFFGGIYLPIGALPGGVDVVVKALPVLHECAMLREIFTKDIIEKTFSGPAAQVIPMYKEEMGITVDMFGKTSTPLFQTLFILGYGVLAFIVATVIINKKGARVM